MKKINEAVEDLSGFKDWTDSEKIDYIINNFEKITGQEIETIFNYDEDAFEGSCFNQDEVYKTSDAIVNFLLDNGLSQKEVDDLLYELDDELLLVFDQYTGSDGDDDGWNKWDVEPSRDDWDEEELWEQDRDHYAKLASRDRADVDEAMEKDKDMKKKLTEGRWLYQLENGRALRSAIEDEDMLGIVATLQLCYQELADHGIIDEDDCEEYTEELDFIDLDDEDAADEIDYQLDEFYDLCDNLKVWVSI